MSTIRCNGRIFKTERGNGNVGGRTYVHDNAGSEKAGSTDSYCGYPGGFCRQPASAGRVLAFDGALRMMYEIC